MSDTISNYHNLTVLITCFSRFMTYTCHIMHFPLKKCVACIMNYNTRQSFPYLQRHIGFGRKSEMDRELKISICDDECFLGLLFCVPKLCYSKSID